MNTIKKILLITSKSSMKKIQYPVVVLDDDTKIHANENLEIDIKLLKQCCEDIVKNFKVKTLETYNNELDIFWMLQGDEILEEKEISLNELKQF